MASIYSSPSEALARLTAKKIVELNMTRAKADSLERSVAALSEAQAERARVEALSDISAHLAAISPSLRDMGGHVAELKAYLQSVYDADLLGDSLLQQLAGEHCVGYTVRLLDLLAEPTRQAAKGAAGVLELGSSTLALFAARPAAHQALVDAGAASVCVKLLSPLYPTSVVVNVANAVGQLAAYGPARLAFRATGGIGALVRLLRPDVEPAAQAAAAAALSLLGAQDMVVQDSVRYLGGLTHLVDLMAADDEHAAAVARCALLSLRSGNTKNQAEIITAIRGHANLVKDLRRLDAASELLRFVDGTPMKAPLSVSSFSIAPLSPTYDTRPATAAASIAAASEVRSLLNDLGDHHHHHHHHHYHLPSSDAAALLSPRGPRTVSVSVPVSPAATASLASALRTSLNITPTRAARVGSAKIDLFGAKQDLYASVPSSPSGSGRISVGLESRLSPFNHHLDVHSAAASLVELESELLRKKHLARFSAPELTLLLEEMGFDSLDLRGFKLHHTTGADLLSMSEDYMLIELVLPRTKARKLRQVQRAAQLFDRIATLPRQGKVSEVELRLYLAGQGASTAEVNKVVKLFKSLVKTDAYDFISFWDFVTSYEWIAQALRIYSIPV